MQNTLVSTAEIGQFDTLIDVRSPAEFAEDHIPGAINLPVLDDEERARIGTLYKQVSPFEAKKQGAALVARNIARHIEESCLDKPKDWKPLIYCWRGGNRSGSMTLIMNRIGWAARQLEGGYKAYRQQVLQDLATLPAQLDFRVACGLTGSGKSRLLAALHAAHAQVLDLEGLARHKGSVLGHVPGNPQPSQKYFESLLRQALSGFDPAQPIFVEAESKKIGNVRAPDSLIERMWQSRCLRLEASTAVRVQLLCEEYPHFIADPGQLGEKLHFLTARYGKAQIDDWKQMAETGQWDQLVSELLLRHYDPSYARSMLQHYPHYPAAPQLAVDSLAPDPFPVLAQQAIALG